MGPQPMTRRWPTVAAVVATRNRPDLLPVALDSIVGQAYEGDVDIDSNSLEVIIARLRRKIGHNMIETVRGRGYRLTSGDP